MEAWQVKAKDEAKATVQASYRGLVARGYTSADALAFTIGAHGTFTAYVRDIKKWVKEIAG